MEIKGYLVSEFVTFSGFHDDVIVETTSGLPWEKGYY